MLRPGMLRPGTHSSGTHRHGTKNIFQAFSCKLINLRLIFDENVTKDKHLLIHV
jgi:hypothetical protein